MLWAPYLMGERTPHLDPDARGVLAGISAIHTRGHVVRAILEGVTFSLKDTFTIFRQLQIPIGKIRLGGGGARSALWQQIQADIYGHGVELLRTVEGAGYGAALLAGVGAGHWKTVDEACAVAIQPEKAVQARPEAVSVMERRYAAYQQLYPRLKGL